MPTDNPASLKHPEFSDPKYVLDLVAAYNEQHGINREQAQLLVNNPALAVAVFNGKVINLIAAGKTNVTELSTAPAELWRILSDLSMQRAITNGVISVSHLRKLSPDRLAEAATHLVKVHAPEAATALELNKLQSIRLREIVEARLAETIKALRLS